MKKQTIKQEYQQKVLFLQKHFKKSNIYLLAVRINCTPGSLRNWLDGKVAPMLVHRQIIDRIYNRAKEGK